MINFTFPGDIYVEFVWILIIYVVVINDKK